MLMKNSNYYKIFIIKYRNIFQNVLNKMIFITWYTHYVSLVSLTCKAIEKQPTLQNEVTSHWKIRIQKLFYRANIKVFLCFKNWMKCNLIMDHFTRMKYTLWLIFALKHWSLIFWLIIILIKEFSFKIYIDVDQNSCVSWVNIYIYLDSSKQIDWFICHINFNLSDFICHNLFTSL